MLPRRANAPSPGAHGKSPSVGVFDAAYVCASAPPPSPASSSSDHSSRGYGERLRISRRDAPCACARAATCPIRKSQLRQSFVCDVIVEPSALARWPTMMVVHASSAAEAARSSSARVEIRMTRYTSPTLSTGPSWGRFCKFMKARPAQMIGWQRTADRSNSSTMALSSPQHLFLPASTYPFSPPPLRSLITCRRRHWEILQLHEAPFWTHSGLV